jgi:hypothetical protein
MKLSLDQQKMIFGFIMLAILAILIGIIALGHVEQQTSYGLEGVIGALATLAGAFGNWAFAHHDRAPEPPKDQSPEPPSK